MKNAILIYNPASGGKKEKRLHAISQVLAVLQSAGVHAEAIATTHAGSATSQTQQAVASGFDTVIACGGDGTMNEVLNGLVLSGSDAALGVVPLGSGNLLATDLRLPRKPAAAAQALLRYKPRALRPGAICYQGKNGPVKRYLIVATGVGSDAELMYRTATKTKELFGMYAYFLEMLRMAVRRKFSTFNVEWLDDQGSRRTDRVTLIMGIRAKTFPGVLRRLRLGSELIRNDYRLMLFRTDKVRHFLHFFCSVASGLNWKVPQVDLAYSTWFRCMPLDAGGPENIHCECDGEVLGRLPVEVCIEQKTFNLLMPEQGS
jgi:YegS/Rv2252/BmrU family lipid kinase